MTAQLLAVITKEFTETVRTRVSLFILAFILGISYLGAQLQKIQAAAGSHPSVAATERDVTTGLVMLAVVLMPVVGHSMLARRMLRERLSRSLVPILATGVRPSVLWAGKLLAAAAACYLVVVACFVFGVVGAKVLDLPVRPVPVAIAGLVAAPLLALALLAIASFMNWTLRFGLIFVGLLTWGVVGLIPQGAVDLIFQPTALVTAVVVAPVALMIVLSVLAMGIDRLSRSYIAGL
ncbi:MAG TPA: hypothetical protein VN700_18205 [Vicinamibacterales bacterium]|nr:hypothetical protein [Vicinamibacterales bacterium]